jgi:Skp family chaperone for outer membrane proteins
MNLKYVDFEKVTSHYTVYRTGVDEINNKKKEFLQEVEPIRKEMNSIITSIQSGLILDNKTQQQKGEKFQQLQQELMQKDNEFKYQLKSMQESLNVKCFDELSVIITDWATENDIDVVSSKMETIFVKDIYDSTDDVIELLKSKELFIELPESLEN